jgi:potassium-transporting ATPase KdpC subunit
MRRQLLTGLMVTIVLTVLLGVVYPLVMTGIAQVAFPHRANGSLVKVNGKVVGSALIGQNFTDAKGNPLARYFQPRPSAAGANGNDPTSSGATNLGPSNATLLKSVADRVAAYRQFNGLAADVSVPVDAVTSSGSGLDPDISEANALDQAGRVAGVRHLLLATVVALVHSHTDGRPWGVLGEKTVNVLDINIALDRIG